MDQYHDLPENKGIENGIKRAKQMTTFRWTPVAPLPAVDFKYDMDNMKTYKSFRARPWFPQKGMIYSSVLSNQKFIGFNVSFEGFVTALSDPRSVLYKYNMDGQGRQNANCWYGVVCSCFVSYVLDMDERWICRNWPTVQGVSCLGQPDLNALKLLDIVLNTNQHIAIITDIVRDEKGNVLQIEVSESTLPFCRATYFTPEEFKGYWFANEFNIYRKTGLDAITYTPSPFVPIAAEPERGLEGDPVLKKYVINPDILPDQGNGTNYKEKQEIVLDLLNDCWDQVEICSEKGDTTVLAAANNTVLIPAVSPAHQPGYYTAKAVNSETGASSEPVKFAITGFRLSPEDPTLLCTDIEHPAKISAGAEVSICFENAYPERPKMIYIHSTVNSGERKRFAITDADMEKGSVSIAFPEKEESFFVFASADNCYGEYASNYLYFTTHQ